MRRQSCLSGYQVTCEASCTSSLRPASPATGMASLMSSFFELCKALLEQAKGQRHCLYRLRPQSCCRTHGVPGSKRSRQTRLGLANPGLVDHSRCAIVMATPAAVITTIVILCVRFHAKTKAASRGRIASMCCRLPHVHVIF